MAFFLKRRDSGQAMSRVTTSGFFSSPCVLLEAFEHAHTFPKFIHLLSHLLHIYLTLDG